MVDAAQADYIFMAKQQQYLPCCDDECQRVIAYLLNSHKIRNNYLIIYQNLRNRCRERLRKKAYL